VDAKQKSISLLAFWIFTILLPLGVAATDIDLSTIQKRDESTIIQVKDLEKLKTLRETLKTTDENDTDVIETIDETKKTESSNTKAGSSFRWPALIQSMFSEYWVEFLALIVSVVGVVLAISGYSFANKKKRKYLKKYLHDIDDVYTSYKMKSRRCEAELFRLQDQIEDRLTAGNIDENTFQLLEGRIQKYMEEIKALERGEGNS
jgi:hypothetical protein